MIKKTVVTLSLMISLTGCSPNQPVPKAMPNLATSPPSDSNGSITNTVDSPSQVDINQKLADAVLKGDKLLVKELLEKGADPNYKDKDGTSLLSYSYSSTDRNHYMFNDVIKLLLNAGADPNVPVNNNGDIALSNAAIRGNIELIKILLSSGANPSLKDKNGRTAIDEAEGFPEILALLRPSIVKLEDIKAIPIKDYFYYGITQRDFEYGYTESGKYSSYVSSIVAKHARGYYIDSQRITLMDGHNTQQASNEYYTVTPDTITMISPPNAQGSYASEDIIVLTNKQVSWDTPIGYSEITGIHLTIDTKAKTFTDCIEITYTGSNEKNEQVSLKQYFAPKQGLIMIKAQSKNNDGEYYTYMQLSKLYGKDAK